MKNAEISKMIRRYIKNLNDELRSGDKILIGNRKHKIIIAIKIIK